MTIRHDEPAPEHLPPPDADLATVEGVGAVSEALETTGGRTGVPATKADPVRKKAPHGFQVCRSRLL
jgi:hypothetical protein